MGELQEIINDSSDTESDDGGFIETAQAVTTEYTENGLKRSSDSRYGSLYVMSKLMYRNLNFQVVQVGFLYNVMSSGQKRIFWSKILHSCSIQQQDGQKLPREDSLQIKG